MGPVCVYSVVPLCVCVFLICDAVQQVFGSWLPVVWAYLFFLLGLVLQRLVMLPVAAAVFRLEAAEGAFRYSHTRFRAWASEIAMYRYRGVLCVWVTIGLGVPVEVAIPKICRRVSSQQPLYQHIARLWYNNCA